MAASDAPDPISPEERAANRSRDHLIDMQINLLVIDRVRQASLETEEADQKSDGACPPPVSPLGTPLPSPRRVTSATLMRASTGVPQPSPPRAAPVAPDASTQIKRVVASIYTEAFASDASDGSDDSDREPLPVDLVEIILDHWPVTPVRSVSVRSSPGAPARWRDSLLATRLDVLQPVAFSGRGWIAPPAVVAPPPMTRAQRQARREFAVWLSEPAAAPSSPSTWVAAPVASWSEESLLTLSLE